MKKFLLFVGIAAAAVSVNAQNFNEYFQVTYGDKEVLDNQTIYCTDHDESDIYHLNIPVKNISGRDLELYGEMSLMDQPTVGEYSDFTAGWGSVSLCYELSGNNQCLPGSQTNPNILGAGTINIPTGETILWDIHNYFFTIKDKPSYYKLTMLPIDDGEETEALYSIKICFAADESSVGSIGINCDLPVEYFDIAGRKVVNPSNGIYIVRQGDKTVKRVIR